MCECNNNLTRKDFLKLTAVTTASLALTSTNTGCSTLPKSTLPRMNYHQGTFLKNCKIIDVNTGTIKKEKSITAINGKIAAINNAQNPPGKNFEIIDAKNNYVIPGLIDAHCHSTLPCLNGFNPWILSDIIIQCDRNYIQQIRSGVTTLRDTGATPKYLPKFLKRIEKGKLIGPRIIYCNQFINRNGSHPDLDPHYITVFSHLIIAITGNTNTDFVNVKDLKHKLEENQKSNPNFLKLTMDDISVLCGKNKIPVYTKKHLKVILDFAEKHQMPIGAHIHRKYGFDRALKYGINNMEHSVGDVLISEKEALAMAKKNITNVPTMVVGQMLSNVEAYDKIPREFRSDFMDNELKIRKDFLYNNNDYAQPSILKSNRKMLKLYKKYSCDNLFKKKKLMVKPDFYLNVLKNGAKNVKTLFDAGVTLGCGTDGGLGNLYHGVIWREIELLSRCGIKTPDLLKCATINNAKILNMEDKIGTLDVNKYADFVILSKNPLKEVKAYRNPLAVFKEGQLMYSRKEIIKNKNTIEL